MSNENNNDRMIFIISKYYWLKAWIKDYRSLYQNSMVLYKW
jgi:hypothetical protein